MANTTQTRYVVGSKEDQTYRVLNFDYKSAPTVSGTTASITTYAYQTFVTFGSLTQSINVTNPATASTLAPLIGDELKFMAVGATAATYSIVFDSAMFKMQTSLTTSVGPNKYFKGEFVYDGTYWVGSGFAA